MSDKNKEETLNTQENMAQLKFHANTVIQSIAGCVGHHHSNQPNKAKEALDQALKYLEPIKVFTDAAIKELDDLNGEGNIITGTVFRKKGD